MLISELVGAHAHCFHFTDFAGLDLRLERTLLAGDGLCFFAGALLDFCGERDVPL